MRTFTINAVGVNGNTYPIYFECDTTEQAEDVVKQLALFPDEAGLCTFEYEVEYIKNDM